jgi:hypothetical protein
MDENTVEKIGEEETLTEQVKNFVCSKTIWVNFVALVAIIVQNKYGYIIDEELQFQILSIINIGLRFITKDRIVWGNR